MEYSVYKHTSPSGKVYIGITSQNPLSRWKSGYGYQDNTYFFNAIRKYGWENFEHEILDAGLDRKAAEKKEIELIAFYKSDRRGYGYNRDPGGRLRANVSDATKEKQRLAHLGQKLSAEQKSKISERLKGRKTSSGMLGHRHSEETKKKMAAARTGKPGCRGAKHPRAAGVVNLTTGESFETITAACLKYNLQHSAISNCCRGLRKKHGKYQWAYKGGDINGSRKPYNQI